MVTKQEALVANEFHYGPCTRRIGPRGGVLEDRNIWRRNGRTKTWARSPERFQVPIKWGLKRCAYLTEDTAEHFHTREACPLDIENIGDESSRRVGITRRNHP